MSPPAGYPHGGVELRLAYLLQDYLQRHPVGRGFGSSQGFALPSGDTVQPDLAFVSKDRWAAAPRPEPGTFPRVVPDLVLEILSPSNASYDRGEKKAIYERNGVREYWLVDPAAQRVVRFCLVEGRWGPPARFELDEHASSLVLPGLTVELASLFELDR
jgi:Uma2 family endonuclease